ncbi:hypothetical protein TBLA_0C02370 [Henningerozyma blattae CBS 6284]|uniref:Sphingolipid long chain base-responsive protein PIL1 n=1 Tax=Henningerozyma blattae (strain ATCC 34711 / CBS 6284 / DSM 70876 / NBRC 10599 / NRRL Y-10934 / UCD 77-7) TaxID=1071380 RepID=I2H0Z6_HENB6|nr:hypothetical protein TBLA_0C02370 [Tetrapisispora blattae CBS 6284]CCH60048.1 hypothetical protein TBLA_0C02370 [Tetrapisispora blattae CBS 6284]
MHKTYSLRGTRAPTASQLRDPPPPRATTKGRFFGKGSIGSHFKIRTAHAFAPEMAKQLTQLVKYEKNILKAMERSAICKRDSAKVLSLWGMENDDDVSDITDKLGVLIYELGELDDQFIDRYDQYRLTLKSIRDVESGVQPSRDRKARLQDKIAMVKFREPDSPKLELLEQEMVRVEAESLVAEAQLSNITRSKLRAAFNYQFDSIIEHSEKMALIGGYGKALLELLDDSPLTPGETRPAYDGYEASKQIIIDCENALNEWTLDSAQVKPTLSMMYPEDAGFNHQQYIDDEEEEPEEEPEEEEYDSNGNPIEYFDEEEQYIDQQPWDARQHQQQRNNHQRMPYQMKA